MKKRTIKVGDTVCLDDGMSMPIMVVSALVPAGDVEGAVDSATVYWFDVNDDLKRGIVPLNVLTKE